MKLRAGHSLFLVAIIVLFTLVKIKSAAKLLSQPKSGFKEPIRPINDIVNLNEDDDDVDEDFNLDVDTGTVVDPVSESYYYDTDDTVETTGGGVDGLLVNETTQHINPGVDKEK